MNLKPHPSYDSMEAHLVATSVRHFQNTACSESPLAQTIENHLLVCVTCQDNAEFELALACLNPAELIGQ